MADKLINTRPPLRGESLIGYILRLTEINYYDSPCRIVSLAGLTKIDARTARAQADLTLMANLAEVPLEDLEYRTYPDLKDDSSPFTAVSFFGHPVAVSIIR